METHEAANLLRDGFIMLGAALVLFNLVPILQWLSSD